MKQRLISLCMTAICCALALQSQATAIARSKEAVIFSFDNTSGASPYAGLIYAKGIFYGAALEGGASGDGTIFALDRKTGAVTVLHSFGSGADGKLPRANLIDVKGTLYGTTLEGGASGLGTFFSLDPATGAETVLHSFGSGTDGEYPVASPIDMKGTLYSTTLNGGTVGDGTVFSIDPETGAETVIHSFAGGTDGAIPYAGLIDVKGMLYGTTSEGGSSGDGTVFALGKP